MCLHNHLQTRKRYKQYSHPRFLVSSTGFQSPSSCFQTWYEKAGGDMKIQRESEHVVDTVYPGHPEQLQQRALALLLALINNGVVAAQHHGGPSFLVGLGWPRVQLPLARLHVWLIEVLREGHRARKSEDERSMSKPGNNLNKCRLYCRIQE